MFWGGVRMQLYHLLGGCDKILHGREFPKDTVVLKLDNGMELVCCNFHHSRKEKLELYVWIPVEKKWVKTYEKNEYTEMMWEHYRKVKRKQQTYQKKHVKSSAKKTKGTKLVKVPNSVSWAMAHPFQGGGVSPR